MPAADYQRSPRPPHALALAVAVVLAAFAVWTVIVESGVLRGLERPLTEWLWRHHDNPLTPLAQAFAYIGVWWVLGPLTVLVAVLLARRRRRGQGVYILLVLATSEALNLALKVVFQRTPPGTNAIEASTYAYPSGHTMAATGLATGSCLRRLADALAPAGAARGRRLRRPHGLVRAST